MNQDYFHEQFGFHDLRARKVVATAWELWFCYQDIQQEPRLCIGGRPVTDSRELCVSLLRPMHADDADPTFGGAPRWAENRIALQFFSFCAEMYLGNRSASIQNTNLVNCMKGIAGRAVSWLCNKPVLCDHPCRPVIAIDNAFLESGESGVPLERLHRTKTCLILHEIGHLVLHWGDLCRQTSAFMADTPLGAPGKSLSIEKDGLHNADAGQEVEAWLFCDAVIALAIAQIAHRGKGDHDSIHDPAWQFCG